MTDPVVPARATSADRLDVRFSELRPQLLRVARDLVGSDDAEDVLHDAYLRARRSIGQLRDQASIDAWLTRIVITTSYNRHRRQRGMRERLPLLARDGGGPERDLALTELIERLPARERTVLVLQHAYGYRLDEIALILGTSHANARSIAFPARRHLAAAWDGYR